MPRAYVAIGLCKCTPYIERIAPIAVFFQTKSLKLLSNRTLTTSSLHRSVLEEHQAFYSIDIIAIVGGCMQQVIDSKQKLAYH